jgi:putative DNA primase/helicase
MSVSTNNTRQHTAAATFSVESFASTHNLTRTTVSGKPQWHGANPIDPSGATKDGFILFAEGNAMDRKTGQKYSASALKNFFNPQEISPPIRGEQLPAAKPNNKKRFDSTASFREFNYTDEKGKLLFQVLRQGDGENKVVSQRRPDARREATGEGGWDWKLGDVRRVLYRLPQIIEAHTVLIVEGEKAADVLNKQLIDCRFAPAVVATCNPHGAGKWREEFSQALKEKTVYVFPDNDEPGEKHAFEVARSVHGVALECKIVELAGRKPKWGADDWLGRGHFIGELLKIAKNAPLFVPVVTTTGAPTAGAYSLDEIGNGEMFAADNCELVRFCHTRSEWMLFADGVWKVDLTRKINQLAKSTGRRAIARAAAMTDPDARSSHLKHYSKMGQQATRNAMITDAASEPTLAADLSQFDCNPHLFNCKNGTVDLATGVFREHRASDLLSFQSPVAYDRAAKCHLWEKCLERWIPDAETRLYLQDSVGLTLSGLVIDEFFNFLHGDGGNGKSKFTGAIEALMGSYWHKTESETLMDAKNARNSGAPNAALLQLKGARLVTAHEIAAHHTLSAALIKDLTGRDAITARGMYEKQSTTFLPQFTLWFFGNYKPKISDSSAGMWRRVRVIEFGQPIAEAEKDRGLSQKLEAELPGILNWALEGLLRVQRRGVFVPESVLSATAEYKAEQDPLAEFLSDCCELHPTLSISNANLWTMWETWAIDNGEDAKSARFLTQQLTRRGLETYKSGGVRGFRGIAKARVLSKEVSQVSQVSQTESVGTLGTLETLLSIKPASEPKPKKREKGNHADSEPGYNRAESESATVLSMETTLDTDAVT